MKKKKTGPAGLAMRLQYPAEEKRIPWLAQLLDAYAIIDTGVAIGIRNEEKREKKKLACTKGCGNCCVSQKDLPLYPHEIVGIYWFVAEKMDPALRSRLRENLGPDAKDGPCPFLVDGSCSIHPLRPAGCRLFNVFTKPCTPGEDPYYTRRDDVLVPPPAYTDRAFAAALPFYALPEATADREGSVRIVRSQIMNLREFDWQKLAALLDRAPATVPG